MEQKTVLEFILDSIDWDNAKKIPDWVDPREGAFWNKGRTPMPEWIQQLSDWSMKTGNRKKIDELLDLAYGEKYKTPWTQARINEFKYGKKINGLPKASSKTGNIFYEYLKAINPQEVYHRDPKSIFDKFDLDKAGIRPDRSKYNPSYGKGAYVSIKDDASLNKLYGDKVSKFFVNPDAKLLSSKDAHIYNVIGHPYFEEQFMGDRFKKYLSNKGYAGINNDWEQVFYNPDKDLLPANTKFQRFVNRFFNAPAIKYGSKIINRVATPLAILEGMGLNQPVGQGSDIVPQYPENNTLYGYINNY